MGESLLDCRRVREAHALPTATRSRHIAMDVVRAISATELPQRHAAASDRLALPTNCASRTPIHILQSYLQARPSPTRLRRFKQAAQSCRCLHARVFSLLHNKASDATDLEGAPRLLHVCGPTLGIPLFSPTSEICRRCRSHLKNVDIDARYRQKIRWIAFEAFVTLIDLP